MKARYVINLWGNGTLVIERFEDGVTGTITTLQQAKHEAIAEIDYNCRSRVHKRYVKDAIRHLTVEDLKAMDGKWSIDI